MSVRAAAGSPPRKVPSGPPHVWEGRGDGETTIFDDVPESSRVHSRERTSVDIDVDLSGAVVRVTVRGKLDRQGTTAVVDQVAALRARRRPVVVDLRDVALVEDGISWADAFSETLSPGDRPLALIMREELMPESVPPGLLVGRDVGEIVDRLTRSDPWVP